MVNNCLKGAVSRNANFTLLMKNLFLSLMKAEVDESLSIWKGCMLNCQSD